MTKPEDTDAVMLTFRRGPHAACMARMPVHTTARRYLPVSSRPPSVERWCEVNWAVRPSGVASYHPVGPVILAGPLAWVAEVLERDFTDR